MGINVKAKNQKNSADRWILTNSAGGNDRGKAKRERLLGVEREEAQRLLEGENVRREKKESEKRTKVLTERR